MSTTQQESRVVVVGGGIGGLAVALGIVGQGHRVTVLERAAEFAEIGAGIQIAPNGLHALDRLGLGDTVRACAVQMDELRFMDGVTGEHVVSLPLTEQYQRRFGNPYVVVHRAELHALLLSACRADGRVQLRSGAPVVGYEQDPTGAGVVLEGGERVRGDAVIGADGINSAVRRVLVGDGEPRNSGITVYRAIVPFERVPAAYHFAATSVVWWAGPGCHVVHYPIAGGSHLNLAASSDNHAPEPFAGRPVAPDEVRREFAALGPDPRRLLDLGADWKSWVLVDRDPVDGWTDGRVALLGDAAHPMLHYAAQGACQALEDAVLLSSLMDGPADAFAQRFEKYNAERRERTARLQLAARESTRLWHPSGAQAVARNALLAGLSATRLHDSIAWMHDAPAFCGVARPSGESGS